MPTGEMTLRLYDHRIERRRAAGRARPRRPGRQLVPRSRRTTATRLTARGASRIWLDGRLLVDVTAPALADREWVEWNACSIGENLSPATAVLYVDDCAVSRTRVGPTGIIARD